MTPEQTKTAFDTCANRIRQYFHQIGYTGTIEPKELSAERKVRRWSSSLEDLQHVLWMCGEGKKFVDEGRHEKAMRWLGFIQGAMFWGLIATIDEMKKMNMPGDGGVKEGVQIEG